MYNLEVSGQCPKEYLKVLEEFKKNFENSEDLGSSFSVYKGGKPIIDLVGGYKDLNKQSKWAKNTIVNVHSVGKGLVAMCISILIDRGLLDLDQPVEKYWPEFGLNGKNEILVKDLLSHQSGMYGWRKPMKERDLYNWNYCTKLLSEQKPFHNLKAETCYHAKTSGYLSGEIIRKISGKTVGRFIQDELVKKRDFQAFIGIPDKYHPLISEIKKYSEKNFINKNNKKKDKYNEIAFQNPPSNFKTYETREWRVSEIPSLNCYSNSRSLAAIYDLFVNTENTKSKIISKETLLKVTKIESNKMDYVMRMPIKWSSVGFIVGGGKLFGKNKDSFGHTGSGGSVAFGDPVNKIGVAYTMNSFSNNLITDKRALSLVNIFYNCINQKI
jgi:CubicO group peptidase (beta-lactamase class C family)